MVDTEQIIALDSVTESVTRIYMRGGKFRDVSGSEKMIKILVQKAN